MKGRIGKIFEAEGRIALESKVTKVITSRAPKDLSRRRDTTGGLGVKQLRWPSGKSVRLLNCRLGFDFESGQANDFGIGITQIFCLTLSIRGDSVENKPASLLVVPLGKALSGIPPSWCGRQMADNS